MLVLIVFVSCSPVRAPLELHRQTKRQFAPEPVYSRVMWAHDAQGISKPRTSYNVDSPEVSPMILPVLSFELDNSNLREAVEALAQAIGYQWRFSAGIANSQISIKMVGNVEEILYEIQNQASVRTILDHKQRVISVFTQNTEALLPEYQ